MASGKSPVYGQGPDAMEHKVYYGPSGSDPDSPSPRATQPGELSSSEALAYAIMRGCSLKSAGPLYNDYMEPQSIDQDAFAHIAAIYPASTSYESYPYYTSSEEDTPAHPAALVKIIDHVSVISSPGLFHGTPSPNLRSLTSAAGLRREKRRGTVVDDEDEDAPPACFLRDVPFHLPGGDHSAVNVPAVEASELPAVLPDTEAVVLSPVVHCPIPKGTRHKVLDPIIPGPSIRTYIQAAGYPAKAKPARLTDVELEFGYISFCGQWVDPDNEFHMAEASRGRKVPSPAAFGKHCPMQILLPEDQEAVYRDFIKDCDNEDGASELRDLDGDPRTRRLLPEEFMKMTAGATRTDNAKVPREPVAQSEEPHLTRDEATKGREIRDGKRKVQFVVQQNDIIDGGRMSPAYTIEESPSLQLSVRTPDLDRPPRMYEHMAPLDNLAVKRIQFGSSALVADMIDRPAPSGHEKFGPGGVQEVLNAIRVAAGDNVPVLLVNNRAKEIDVAARDLLGQHCESMAIARTCGEAGRLAFDLAVANNAVAGQIAVLRERIGPHRAPEVRLQRHQEMHTEYSEHWRHLKDANLRRREELDTEIEELQAQAQELEDERDELRVVLEEERLRYLPGPALPGRLPANYEGNVQPSVQNTFPTTVQTDVQAPQPSDTSSGSALPFGILAARSAAQTQVQGLSAPNIQHPQQSFHTQQLPGQCHVQVYQNQNFPGPFMNGHQQMGTMHPQFINFHGPPGNPYGPAFHLAYMHPQNIPGLPQYAYQQVHPMFFHNGNINMLQLQPQPQAQQSNNFADTANISLRPRVLNLEFPSSDELARPNGM